MLVLQFLSHQYKAFIRNARWRRNVLSKIMYAIIILYLIGLFIYLGLYIDKILAKVNGNAIDSFNSALLWYFSIDLLIRCILQPLPTLQVIPYLRIRISRSKIIYYLLFRGYWNLFNFLPWLLIVPFSVKVIMPYLGIEAVIFYLFSFFLLVTFNNYLAFLLGFLSRKNFAYYLIPVGVLTFITAFEHLGLSINETSTALGNLLLNGNPFMMGILIMSIVFIVAITRRHLVLNLYLDEISKKNTFASFSISEMNKLGNVGHYMWLEINLLLRNKRPRQAMMMLPIMIVYFLFFINSMIHKGTLQNLQLMIVLSMIMVFGASAYGQFIFSWESSYIDGILARKNFLVAYIKAKYYLMSTLVIVSMLPFLVTFSLSGKISITLLLSIFLFTLGVICFITIFFGSYNDGKIDLSQNQFFNYQGIKNSHFIVSLIMMTLPLGTYTLFDFLINDTWGKLALAIPGLFFIFTHDWWIKKIIVTRFIARKYKNLEGYRILTF